MGGQFYTKVDPDGKGIENVTFQVKDGDIPYCIS